MMEFSNGPFNEDIYLQEEFLKLRDKYGVKEVIETGSHKGVTTEWLAQNFDRVQSVEIKQEYINEALKRLQPYENVSLYKGDSRELLILMMEDSKNEGKNLLVFCDAHWLANPVLDELRQIKESGKKPIVVIHDFYNPLHPEYGYDRYPDQGIVYNWPWIQPHVEAIYGVDGFDVHYNDKATGAKRGCIFIVPK